MRIAFYAPMKAADADRPSGDRRMAQLLLRALATAGHEVEIASTLRMADLAGEPLRQLALQRLAQAEADRLLCGYAALPLRRPDAWLTYHVYHKAPDVIGPLVATALDLPYLIVEPSVAEKRRRGPWEHGFALASRAIARADLLLCLTRHDMPGVTRLAGSERVRHLPPFLDVAPYALARPGRESARLALSCRHGLPRDATWLLAVGMFRSGDKLESYRRLGAALSRLEKTPSWQLLVVGDGPAEPEVRAALSGLSHQPNWLGRLDEADLPAVYAASDLVVWPAANEAFGMAMLEAAAAGCPVVSCDTRGVPDVVVSGRTGLLVPPDDPAAFAAAVNCLLRDPPLRRRQGRAATVMMDGERDLAIAAGQLDKALRDARDTRQNEGSSGGRSSGERSC